MSKYIDSEKLIAEIERLSAEHSSRYGMDEAAIVLDKLEDFITSLQQEQPEGGCSEKPNNLLSVQPDVDLEEYLSAKLFFLGADLIRHKPYSFNRGLNVGMTKAYDDILKKINVKKEK